MTILKGAAFAFLIFPAQSIHRTCHFVPRESCFLYASFIHIGETLGDISLYNSFRFGIANPTPGCAKPGIRCLPLSREICMAVTTQAGNRTGTRCATCSAPLEPGARFCGECGASMHRPQPEPSQSSCNNGPGNGQTPSFARPKGRNTVDPAMTKELGSLLVLLARERIFLIMHWVIFRHLELDWIWTCDEVLHRISRRPHEQVDDVDHADALHQFDRARLPDPNQRHKERDRTHSGKDCVPQIFDALQTFALDCSGNTILRLL